MEIGGICIIDLDSWTPLDTDRGKQSALGPIRVQYDVSSVLQRYTVLRRGVT